MDVKLQRVGLIVLVTLVTLGVLTGIQLGWKKFVLNDPVVVKLTSIQGVTSVNMKTEKSEPIIELQLKDVSNLKETSRQVLEAAGNSRVLLIDKRTPELQALLEKTRFDIEEAMVRGNFTAMEQSIEAVTKQANLDRYGVYIDSDNIYLQFHKGDNYLYQVFNRQSGKGRIITKG